MQHAGIFKNYHTISHAYLHASKSRALAGALDAMAIAHFKQGAVMRADQPANRIEEEAVRRKIEVTTLVRADVVIGHDAVTVAEQHEVTALSRAFKHNFLSCFSNF